MLQTLKSLHYPLIQKFQESLLKNYEGIKISMQTISLQHELLELKYYLLARAPPKA